MIEGIVADRIALKKGNAQLQAEMINDAEHQIPTLKACKETKEGIGNFQDNDRPASLNDRALSRRRCDFGSNNRSPIQNAETGNAVKGSVKRINCICNNHCNLKVLSGRSDCLLRSI
jgi:hypothetical protein